jgi:hypothetical protein
MDHLHQRPAPGEYNEYYGKYISRVPTGDISALLRDQIGDTRALLASVKPGEADCGYAPGKWTIKEVVGHLCDTERIMSYRALRIARGDKIDLHGFDENEYVPAGSFGDRDLASLTEELTTVRNATIALLRGLPHEAWPRRGSANGSEVSVRALASIIAGHELHHRELLETRYLGRSV